MISGSRPGLTTGGFSVQLDGRKPRYSRTQSKAAFSSAATWWMLPYSAWFAGAAEFVEADVLAGDRPDHVRDR